MTESHNDHMQKQLALFGFFGNPPTKKQKADSQIIHSNTISIYDALPKYQWSTALPKGLNIQRYCVIDGVEYEVTIIPAIIERKNYKTKITERVEVYPGEREEAVEDVLRGFAANGQGKIFEHEIGVNFTIRQVVNELKSLGKTYSLSEVVEAIHVCNRASMSIKISSTDKVVVNSALFPTFALVNRKNYMSDSSAQCFVRFHPMVTAAVINVEYRLINYRLAMAIRNPLARHIFKRMSHYWRQASPSLTYRFKLISYLAQTPRNLSPRMDRNISAMNKALDELIQRGVLGEYKTKETIEGRSIKDVEYECWPHINFIADIKKANYVEARRSLYNELPALPRDLK